MDINKVTAVYFVGAGGIGMSALIRIFSLRENEWADTIRPLPI